MKDIISGFVCNRCGKDFSVEKFKDWDEKRFISFIKEQGGELCISCCKKDILENLKKGRISKFKLLKFKIKDFFYWGFKNIKKRTNADTNI